MTPIILASESPRRRELLKSAGYKFDVFPVKVSEIPDKNLNVNEQILDIARRKAHAAFAALKASGKEDFLLISADTEVIYNNTPLGKPENSTDAHRILRLLSGKRHQVLTAICLIDGQSGKELSQIETTQIYFKELSDQEIWTYIESGEPMDKAGAYGIQGLGRAFVQRFEGPFDNVVGLPLDLLSAMLSKFSTGK